MEHEQIKALKELINTALNGVRDDVKEIKEHLKEMMAEHKELRDKTVDCRVHCERARSDIWSHIGTLKEYRASMEGFDRSQKARGEIDYVFWVKVAALMTGASVVAFLIISIIQMAMRQV